MPSNQSKQSKSSPDGGYVYLGKNFVGRVLKDDKGYYHCFIRGCGKGKGIEHLTSLTRHLKQLHSNGDEDNIYNCSQIPNQAEHRDGKILVKGDIEVPQDSSRTTTAKRSGGPAQDRQKPRKKRKTEKQNDSQDPEKLPQPTSQDPTIEVQSSQQQDFEENIPVGPDLHEPDDQGSIQGGASDSMVGIDATLDLELNEHIATSLLCQMNLSREQSFEAEDMRDHAKQFNLNEYGLKLYRELVFYCSFCSLLLLKDEACRHWRKQHSAGSLLLQIAPKDVLEHRLKKHIESLDGLSQTRDDFISVLPPPHKRRPFDEFKILPGFSCPGPNCAVVHACWETMRAHIRDTHPSSDKTKIPTDCQRIWGTGVADSTCCIAVNKSLRIDRQINSGVLSRKLLNTPWFSSQPEEDSTLGEIGHFHRRVSGYLSALGYTDRVEKIPVSTILEVTRLSSFPAPLLCKLRKLSQNYLEFTQCQIKESVVYFPDLLENLGQRGKLVKDKLRILTPKIVSQYSLTICRFVAFGLTALRTPDVFATLKVSITRKQLQALETLHSELVNHPYDSLKDNLEHEFYDEEFLDEFEEESDDGIEVRDENTNVDVMADSRVLQSVFHLDGMELLHLPLSLQSIHRYILACFQLDALEEETTLFSLVPSYAIFSSLRSDGKFKSPAKQTPFNARLKYIGKAAFLHDRINQVSQKEGFHQVNRSQQPENITPWSSCDTAIITPYMWLSRAQSKLTGYTHDAPNLATVSWDVDSKEHVLTYEDHRISMAVFSNFISSLHQEVNLKLKELLLGIPTEDVLHPFEQYNDNVQDESESYNYLSDSTNLEEFVRLYHRMCQDNRYCDSINGVMELKVQKIQEYLKSCEEFVLHLFVAIYFTSGMPPRATELLATLCRNTKARMRDIFTIGNEMVIRSLYTKTNNLTETAGRTLRLISPSIANAVDVYLKYIAPFSFFLVMEHFPSIHARGLIDGNDIKEHLCFTHLFATNGTILPQHSVYQHFKTCTEQAFGFPLGISDARHIMIAIGRRYIPPISFSNPFCERQANHSVKIARRHYAVARYLPKGIWEDEAQQFFYTSKFWQFLWKFREFEEIPQPPQTNIAEELFRILLKNDRTISLDPEVGKSTEPPWIDKDLNYPSKNAYDILSQMFP